MILTRLFCDVDDFYQTFIPQWGKTLIETGERKRKKQRCISCSEIITLIPKGTMVEVGTCTNGWCKVSWNGQDGYSIATNLGLGGPPPVRRRPMADDYDYPPPPGTYGPPPAYVVGPPVYFGGPVYYGGYYGPYYGPRWRGGWGWRRHW